MVGLHVAGLVFLKLTFIVIANRYSIENEINTYTVCLNGFDIAFHERGSGISIDGLCSHLLIILLTECSPLAAIPGLWASLF